MILWDDFPPLPIRCVSPIRTTNVIDVGKKDNISSQWFHQILFHYLRLAITWWPVLAKHTNTQTNQLVHGLKTRRFLSIFLYNINQNLPYFLDTVQLKRRSQREEKQGNITNRFNKEGCVLESHFSEIVGVVMVTGVLTEKGKNSMMKSLILWSMG